LQVAPGVAGGVADAVSGSADSGAAGAAGEAGGVLPAARLHGDARIWAWATAGFALLWLATLVWALQRRAPAVADAPEAARGTTTARAGLRELRRALDSGD